MRLNFRDLTAVAALGLALAAPARSAAGFPRYFHMGDGTLFLVNAKTDQVFQGRYRNSDGSYIVPAVAAIHELFGARYGAPEASVSLRLVEFLDFLEDRLRPGTRVLIVSGFRDPEYNQRLRDRGGIVAKASLHQYGLAADVIFEGVPSKTVWDYVKNLHYGGAGYYHDATVHLDVGRARFWDEQSAKVRSDLSDHNKSIGLMPEYDRYRPGERLILRFIQVTALPIGVRTHWLLESAETEGTRPPSPRSVQPELAPGDSADCRPFSSISALSAVALPLPSDLSPGRYRLCAPLCDRLWEDMPALACSPVFEVDGG